METVCVSERVIHFPNWRNNKIKQEKGGKVHSTYHVTYGLQTWWYAYYILDLLLLATLTFKSQVRYRLRPGRFVILRPCASVQIHSKYLTAKNPPSKQQIHQSSDPKWSGWIPPPPKKKKNHKKTKTTQPESRTEMMGSTRDIPKTGGCIIVIQTNWKLKYLNVSIFKHYRHGN